MTPRSQLNGGTMVAQVRWVPTLMLVALADRLGGHLANEAV